MRLVIKTPEIEIEYQDEYSLLEEPVKNRLESIIKTIHSTQPTNAPAIGTVEEIFNRKAVTPTSRSTTIESSPTQNESSGQRKYHQYNRNA